MIPATIGTSHSGKERDVETGNDYFLARYYNSATGRFLSPDWSAKEDPVPYAKLDDPQTLNLYVYVLNNPLRMVDPDGHLSEEGEKALQETMQRVYEDLAKARQKAQQAGTPSALTVKSVEVLDTKGQNGINIAVTYQIVDASGNPVKGKHMMPTEHVDEKQQKSGTPIPLSCAGFCQIGPTAVPGTSKYSGKDGTFKDAPVGSTFESGGGGRSCDPADSY